MSLQELTRDNGSTVDTNPQRSSEICKGCFKKDGCGLTGRPSETMHLQVKRSTGSGTLRFECHTIFEDAASKPPDTRAARREHGEAGVQY